MRPTYESEGNRADERAIADLIELAWSCRVKKLPHAYHLDYGIRREGRGLVAWAEIKRRFRTFDQYPDTWLSLHKVFAAHNFHHVSKYQCLFIVQFNDCLAYADMLVPDREIEWRGREDRGDWQDFEPVALVPANQFKKINGGVA